MPVTAAWSSASGHHEGALRSARYPHLIVKIDDLHRCLRAALQLVGQLSGRPLRIGGSYKAERNLQRQSRPEQATFVVPAKKSGWLFSSSLLVLARRAQPALEKSICCVGQNRPTLSREVMVFPKKQNGTPSTSPVGKTIHYQRGQESGVPATTRRKVFVTVEVEVGQVRLALWRKQGSKAGGKAGNYLHQLSISV